MSEGEWYKGVKYLKKSDMSKRNREARGAMKIGTAAAKSGALSLERLSLGASP